MVNNEIDAIRFWQSYLEGCNPRINILGDKNPLNKLSNKSDFIHFAFSRGDFQGIKDLSTETGKDLKIILLSAFGAFIQKFSGDEDINIVFSTDSFLDNQPDDKEISVVRFNKPFNCTFPEYLRNVADGLKEVEQNSVLSATQIIETAGIGDSGIQTLSNISFSLSKDKDGRPNKTSDKESLYDLSYNFIVSEEDIQVEVLFKSHLYNLDTINRLNECFKGFISNMLNNTHALLSSVSLITESDLNFIAEINDTKTEYPRNKTLQEIFNEQVQKYGNKTAISYKKTALTYSQLNERANQLAHTLRMKGVEPDMPVGLLLDKSNELIIALLAIIKAGAAYLPIDSEYPEQRIEFMLKDSSCRFLLVQDKLSHITYENVETLNIDSAELYSDNKEDLPLINKPEDLAYVMYTSGTTGLPKGSLIMHYNILRLVKNTNCIDISEQDNTLFTGAIVFDPTTLEIWGTLLNGGTLYITDKDIFLSPALLEKELIENKISVIITSAALFNQLSEIAAEVFRYLRFIMVGGEVLSAMHVNKVRKINPSICFVNGYGPTENTTCSTTYKITEDFDSNTIPIGKPISNSTTYIFDRDMNYQPVGAIGELYVGGDGLSRGYLNREDLNKKNFIEHPMYPGMKIYNTGDLARWLPDGNIEFHGRRDNQLKLGGFRIELGEIETVISKIDGVVETVVKAIEVRKNDVKLVAFINISDKTVSNNRLIEDAVNEKLPAFMRPSAFKFMNGFPKTINGKIDKKALKITVEEIEIAGKKDRLKPESETEQILLDIWTGVLHSSNISTDDDFFDIGGTSLKAMSLLNRIKEITNVSFSFREFSENATIQLTGKLIDGDNDKVADTIELKHLTDIANLPLTFNQKRLWLIDRMGAGTPSYVIPVTYSMQGKLNPDIFKRSLTMLFERHHILFSRFKEVDGEPRCEITPTEVVINFVDYSDVPENQKEAKINAYFNTDSTLGFDLENGPLYRIHLLKTAELQYYFHMSIHHIVFDGWSWPVFSEDLSLIYNSLNKGETPKLSRVEVQQYDFAAWEESQVGSKAEKEAIKYWQENLQGASPVINFPYDYARKAKPTGMGSFERIKISKESTEKLRRISKEEGASLFTTLMSMFGIQMHIYSGEDDLNIGVPVAYRPHSKLENIVGMFVNTLIVRLKYQSETSLREIIKLTNEVALKALENQNLTFDRVVEIVNPERSSNVNPLVQVAFAWQNSLDIPFKIDGVNCEQIWAKERIAEFDLGLYIWENGDIIEGEINYNSDLFNRDSIIRLRENFIHLVSVFTENPESNIRDISYLSEQDSLLLAAFNSTQVEIPSGLVHNLFEEQVIKHSESKAIQSGSRTLTYNELNRKANQMARHLQSQGVSAGDVIGISLERTEAMVISVLAVLKTGCCYLPMDPSFPDDRLAYMFEDSGARVLISESSLKEKFVNFPEHTCVLTDSDASQIGENGIENLDLDLSNQQLAYIIYTSGSTGKPKGVKVHHEAVVNFISSMQHEPGISKDDKLLAVTTLSFDISVLELFLPLASGAEIILADSEDVIDGQKLKSLLNQNDITVLQATPATWNLLLSEGWQGKNNLKALCGGEAIPSSLIRDLLPKVSCLWNMYGPTETTVWSTCFEITDADAPVIVGKPIDNTTVYIIDDKNRPLPVGVFGEVAIGGLGVTKGYHNREELTSEKFILFNDKEIVYRTGDQGRFLSDGNIELAGRIDNQIKLRGFRIEPGEIETLLSKLPEVKEVVVKVHQFEQGDERLVAFLNVNNAFNLEKEQIIDDISKNLPTYMVPSFYQISESFPRLPNGKINKKALRFEMTTNQTETKTDLSSLSTTQQKLVEIWQQILKTSDIDVSGNFFDIGGNSLLTMKLINKIKEVLGVTLSFKEFITHSSVILAGNFIDSLQSDKEKAIQLVHTTQKDNLSLTNNQKRLWLISQLNPDVPSYIISYTNKLTGDLNTDVFKESVQKLFERHHTVFSVFKERDNEPYCTIVPSEVNVSAIDYSELSETEKSEKVKKLIEKDSLTPFNLSTGPLFRIYLIKIDSLNYIFHLSIHHIVFDEWSWSVFNNELAIIYNSLLKNEHASLEPVEFYEYDYAAWEQQEENKKNIHKSVEFWKANLDGATSVLNFPYDSQRKEQSSGVGISIPVCIPKDITCKLKELSKSEGLSLYSILMSVFGIQMHLYSNQEDFNIGTMVSNRPHSKLENIFGMFVNTVVVRLNYEKGLNFKKIIKRTSEAALNAIAHQDVSFDRVVEIVKPERTANVNPLFQTAFTWQNFTDQPVQLDGVSSEMYFGEKRTGIFDLLLLLSDNGDTIEGVFEYNMDILYHETVEQLRNNFMQILRAVLENPETDISSISFLTDYDKSFMANYNNTDAAYENNICIHEKFEQQVLATPDLPAIADKQLSLSYAEFNEHANRLAHHLIATGVNPEDKVAICLDRSVEMMIGIFAVLKAGAAYVPLNPENPTDRLRSIIEEANLRYILSDTSASQNLPGDFSFISLDNILKEPLSENIQNPKVQVSSRSLAYVLYTSGSTGKPKGVMIEHHSVLNRLGWMQKAYPVDTTDTLVQKTPITFDVSVWELFWWSFNGARLFLLPKGGEKDPEELLDCIENNNITTIHFVPSMFASFFETASTKGLFDKMKNLNRIFCSGEALPLKIVEEFNQRRNEYRLPDIINLYGPTEATVDVSYYNCPNENIEKVYIGRPIDNTRLYVINDKQVIQPVGVPGELLITGVNLARGYMNQPELTGEKFIDFRDDNNEVIKGYRSGDLVKLTPKGEIDYIGRIDNQVKIRGFRIELGDIEAKILLHEKVSNCAVIVDGKEDNKFLVAYVALRKDEDLSQEQLRDFLFGKLPDYMVPSFITFLEKVPLTTSGKLDRKSLPKVDFSNRQSTLTLPANEIENKLLDIWKSILEIEAIGTSDNFFDVGGNSILAISLTNKISKEFNISVKALFVFENPRIKDQSNFLSGLNDNKLSETLNQIEEKNLRKKNVNFKRYRR